MFDAWWFVGALAVCGGITFGLRALPFVALKPLRDSKTVQRLSVWMPAGILAILAAVTFSDFASEPRTALWAALALAVTVGVHLGLGRRTLLSVGLGTATFVVLVNLF
ncbi:branched-chain amino acid transporter AzlD [Pseudoclavibacter sp. RFBJ3]|uniref:branched-chain amino acid transporter permease n=1 Tax=unclassified Pseudoclavibacter TaxID=2615177 RepID=UPI000CE887F6|nr:MULTISPECIES: AzlD domain-containing protein [unclassified Pseudoclavibacter]MBF4551693.1 AzlD domain-containing protein [Pseudoclavibacter sp. VKM Ac-2888]PPF80980.1 branched-chain amino acid transporter AzlD [Pseudoclavibacter sp. RFBJ5]PPF94488.1 branched-chain amino acid transporter AzlD [Pseudoclavibacter sp. RFBJ3]PPF99596.1 branched-chain amino acid transporter AzlD [Pseudoclavibacter sp. RFBH5]PPG25790.1 branched-chain amino acid transporter AzlD [Pseudoclavibacter sp. RFBI4]